MHRRTAAIVVLVAALLVAGCAGATDDGPRGTDRAADSAGSGGATPTPGPQVYDLPLDGDTVATAHDEALAAAGSFTVDTNVTVVDGSTGEAFAVVATAAVDPERGTMLLRGTAGALEGQTTYVGPNGTAFQRVETDTGAVEYRQLADAPDASGYFELPVETLVEEANFTYAGRNQATGWPGPRCPSTR